MVPSKQMVVSYTIRPPSGIDTDIRDTNRVTTAAEIQFALPEQHSFDSSRTSSFYSAVTLTLRQAQAHLNATMTAWKDAIGDREKSKEDLGNVAFGQGKASRMTGSMQQLDQSLMAGWGIGEVIDSDDE
jgi:hypothetical protein